MGPSVSASTALQDKLVGRPDQPLDAFLMAGRGGPHLQHHKDQMIFSRTELIHDSLLGCSQSVLLPTSAYIDLACSPTPAPESLSLRLAIKQAAPALRPTGSIQCTAFSSPQSLPGDICRTLDHLIHLVCWLTTAPHPSTAKHPNTSLNTAPAGNRPQLQLTK